LLEKDLSLSLNHVLESGYSAFSSVPNFNVASKADLSAFIFDRMTTYLKDRGASQQEISAVLALNPDVLTQIPKRLEAVKAFAALPQAASLAAANKRISNLLKKAALGTHAPINSALLASGAETNLAQLLTTLEPTVQRAFHSGDYQAALVAVASAKDSVDEFFANVMVMDENLDVRNNRLALLAKAHELMNRVADISMLAT
jgi:glycyl-tRNA synthetase beta chain